MDGELLSLKWNNHRTTFYHVISGLRNKESYTDVTLACDGKFYPAHKFVLSTCSEYFSEIFDRTPCKNPVVVLKDIQCRDLEFLLDYMYIGEVNVRQNELSSLIKSAECLRVKGLAVPDEEPKRGGSANSVSNSVSQNTNRQRPEQSSPPAKRRRAEERRVTSTPVVTDQSPGRPPGDGALNSPDLRDSHVANADRPPDQPDDGQGDSSDISAIIIKEEKDDDIVSVQNNYEGGDDDGDGPHDSEGNTSTSDFPEFLQSTIEKEEPVAISEFNPDFPGPSGLQNSGLAPWESENSTTGFPEGLSGAVAAAVAAVSQPQQRQQQQLMSGGGPLLRPTASNSGLAMSDEQLHEEPTDLGVYTCSFCSYKTGNRHELNTHVQLHTGGWPYACTQCNYKTRRSHDLKRHILSRHYGGILRPFRCQLCPYRTTHSIHLTSHIMNKHPNESEYLVARDDSQNHP